jgi:hypothetical protein
MRVGGVMFGHLLGMNLRRIGEMQSSAPMAENFGGAGATRELSLAKPRREVCADHQYTSPSLN